MARLSPRPRRQTTSSIKTRIMKFRLILTLSLFALIESPVCAAVTAYNFSGALDAPFGTLETGTTFAGSFSYDTSQTRLGIVTDPITGAPTRGEYVYSQFNLNISGQLFSSDSGPIFLYDFDPVAVTGFVVDLLEIYTLSLSGSLGGLTLAPDAGIVFVLQDLTGNVFNGLNLPGDDLTLNDFTLTGASFLQLQEQFPADLSGSVATSRGGLSSLTSVPEPSSPLLFLAGLSTLLFARFRMG